MSSELHRFRGSTERGKRELKVESIPYEKNFSQTVQNDSQSIEVYIIEDQTIAHSRHQL